MKQPELGDFIFEKRTGKGMTQEELAEQCEVSTRTIQRIESGEVEPRAYTLNNLSRILEFDFGSAGNENETFWLAVMHLSSCLCFLLIPLLIWSWKKRSSNKITQHGRHVLNFQITMTLILFAAAGFMLILPPLVYVLNPSGESPIRLINLVVVTLTLLPMIGIGLFCFVEGIINTVRMLNDNVIHYPLSIPFIK